MTSHVKHTNALLRETVGYTETTPSRLMCVFVCNIFPYVVFIYSLLYPPLYYVIPFSKTIIAALVRAIECATVISFDYQSRRCML